MNKIAFLIDNKKWAVHDPQIGWVAADGSTAHVQASQRHTKFFATVEAAKVEGFSPSPQQQAAIAKWEVKEVKKDVKS